LCRIASDSSILFSAPIGRWIIESVLVVASIISEQVPAMLGDAIIVVMTGRSRERRRQGTDRYESRLAPVSAPIVRERPLDIPRGIHRIPFPMSVTPFNDGGIPDYSPAPLPSGKAVVDTQAFQEAPPHKVFP
jgi:hypothetical protein